MPCEDTCHVERIWKPAKEHLLAEKLSCFQSYISKGFFLLKPGFHIIVTIVWVAVNNSRSLSDRWKHVGTILATVKIRMAEIERCSIVVTQLCTSNSTSIAGVVCSIRVPIYCVNGSCNPNSSKLHR